MSRKGSNERGRKKGFWNYFALVLAIAFLVAGVVFEFIQKKDDRNYDKMVDAVVKRVEKRENRNEENEYKRYEYKAVCEYVSGGKTYTYETDWSDHEYHKEDKITLNINSDDPGMVNIHLFRAIAIVCFISAAFSFYFFLRG